MSSDCRKEIVRHLSEDVIDRLLAGTDDEKVSKRLIFIRRLYKGATLEEAADDVGKSASTGTHPTMSAVSVVSSLTPRHQAAVARDTC